MRTHLATSSHFDPSLYYSTGGIGGVIMVEGYDVEEPAFSYARVNVDHETTEGLFMDHDFGHQRASVSVWISTLVFHPVISPPASE